VQLIHLDCAAAGSSITCSRGAGAEGPAVAPAAAAAAAAPAAQQPPHTPAAQPGAAVVTPADAGDRLRDLLVTTGEEAVARAAASVDSATQRAVLRAFSSAVGSGGALLRSGRQAETGGLVSDVLHGLAGVQQPVHQAFATLQDRDAAVARATSGPARVDQRSLLERMGFSSTAAAAADTEEDSNLSSPGAASSSEAAIVAVPFSNDADVSAQCTHLPHSR
jgi:hypothetical protein